MRAVLPAFALLAACGGGEDLVTLNFVAQVGGETAACGVDLAAGTGTDAVQLADARFLLSDLEARNTDGEWEAIELDVTDWQNSSTALLDFEDGSGACADSGTSDLNTQITGLIAAGEYDTLRFTVGVPFADNHLDSATAPAPLNAPGMFWAWQSGYKFVRVDFAVQSETPSRWNVHVGSTGCISDGSTQAPTEECGKPNRSTVTVEDIALDGGTVNIDLGALVSGLDLAANTAETPPGCMSSPGEPADCGPAFGSLGLSFESGACVDDCDGQRLFSAGAAE